MLTSSGYIEGIHGAPYIAIYSSTVRIRHGLPSGEHRPWQSSGLEDEFPLKLGYFQGPTVNLPEGS